MALVRSARQLQLHTCRFETSTDSTERTIHFSADRLRRTMPAIAGVRNTNKRPRLQPTAGNNDHSASDAPSNNSSHPQRRRPNAPTVNRTVDQSLFGDTHKQSNLKQQIRSIGRLLNKSQQLDATLVQRKQTELRILTDQLSDKQRRGRLDRIDRRYKMVKFIERQKVVRRMRALHRRLTGLTSTSRGASEEEKVIRAEMERVQADLDYIDYYPRGTKYVALFATSKTEAEEKGQAVQGDAGRTATEDEDDDSDSELVVGGKHSKPHPNRPAIAPTLLPNTDEHKADTDNNDTATTTPSTATTPSTPQPADNAKAAERAAALEAQRTTIREAVKRAKAKATAGEKKAAAVASGAGSKKEKRRREFKDDFFVFEGQGEGDEQREGDRDDDEAGDENERQDEQRGGKERGQDIRPNGGRSQAQRRDSGDGVDKQNGRQQQRLHPLHQREARQPFEQHEAAATHNSDRTSLQRKRLRDEEAQASDRHDSVGQKRSAYNPDKHVRVSQVKPTARKIADVDMEDDRVDETPPQQQALERKEAVDTEAPAGEESSAKRKRKRTKRKRPDKPIASAEKANKTQRHRRQRQQEEDTDAPQPSSADHGQPALPKKASGASKGKQRKAAQDSAEQSVEEDERRETKQQELEVRNQRRLDVKSLLQLDDKQSDDEQ